MNKLTTLIVSLTLCVSALATEPSALSLNVYNAGSHSFNVTSAVIYGETEAAVIDAGFTKADALRIAANVLDSGKKLTTIFVSQADPDYYFGVETLKPFFPDAKVLATPAVLRVIKDKLANKLSFWAPKMGANAPVNPVLPTAYNQSSFMVDSTKVEIKGLTGPLAHRPYLWIPSEKTILGNVAVSAGLHVWMADTQSKEQLNAWLSQLHEMKALSPVVVLPGHMTPGTELDITNIDKTVSYLETFIDAKVKSKNSEELIKVMVLAFPNAKSMSSLELSAKVHTGEMKW
jgi:glyoxylase-like metal-dependent hydrolase (beta-lactamase superfamily II)